MLTQQFSSPIRDYLVREGGQMVRSGMKKALIQMMRPSAKDRLKERGPNITEQYKRSRTGSGGSGVVSFQNDSVLRYRKRRVSRRKRRAWKRFSRRVMHVDLQMQPLQIYTVEGTANLTSAVNQSQVWSRMCGGTTVTLNDEIYQCFQGAYNIASVAACNPYKIFLKSVVLDVQCTNTGSYPVIIDLYILRNSSKFASATDVGAQYNQALGEVASPAGGGSISTTKTALTVFDAPNFCSYWKVLSKREVIVGTNQTVTFQLRSPQNRHVEGKELQSSLQCLRGTKAFLFDWHGQPCNRGTLGAAQFDSTALTFGYQTVVHYAVPPSSVTKEAGKSA